MQKENLCPVQTQNEQSVKKAVKLAQKETLRMIIGYQAKYIQFKVKQNSVVAFCKYKGRNYAASAIDFAAALNGLRERIRYDEYQKEKAFLNIQKLF